MVGRNKIIILAAIVICISACKKKKACDYFDGESIVMFPEDYKNYYTGVAYSAKSLSWKSSKGLNDITLVSTYDGWMGFESGYGEPTPDCKRRVGQRKAASYSGSLYMPDLNADMHLGEHNEIWLNQRFSMFDTSVNRRIELAFMKNITNDQPMTCQRDYYTNVTTDPNDFIEKDSVTLNGTTYTNLFQITNSYGLTHGDGNSIVTFYIDRINGPVGYITKKGDIWNRVN